MGSGVTARARIAQITIDEARSAQKEYLQKPVQDNGNLAEEECPLQFGRNRLAMNVGRDENIVHDHERQRQHRRGAKDVQCIRQGKETPFGGGKVENVANHHA